MTWKDYIMTSTSTLCCAKSNRADAGNEKKQNINSLSNVMPCTWRLNANLCRYCVLLTLFCIVFECPSRNSYDTIHIEAWTTTFASLPIFRQTILGEHFFVYRIHKMFVTYWLISVVARLMNGFSIYRACVCVVSKRRITSKRNKTEKKNMSHYQRNKRYSGW